ncbi:MAG: penicillin-binding protein 1C [Bacteroidales bacterium]|nr:penicillin-binding protein 1C [Bacteroidales bacterium]
MFRKSPVVPFLWQRKPPGRLKRLLWLVAFCLLGKFYLLLPNPLFNVTYSTVVSDREGQLLGARISQDGQWRFPPQEAPLNGKFVTALIQYEDKRFYRHWGVDWLAVGRAVRQNLQAGHVVSGASTITMQTVRLARNRERTLGEKMVEMVWAFRLECGCSKEEILQLYSAHAPFGGNVVGLEAASWRYFNHSSADLSWAEAALLAVLPNSPSMMHLGKNRDNLKAKRDRLLRNLMENGLLSEEACLLALEEELPQSVYALPQTAPHLVTWMHRHERGRQIQTTIDAGLQQQVEQVMERWAQKFAEEQIRNMAVLVVDVRSNEVRAYCGNSLSDTATSQVDVIRSVRSSGSILKPFLYAAALQDGVLLPHMLLPDVPINLNGFSPHNFNYRYDGAVPADKALSRSLNVPMVMLLKQYGLPKFYLFLKKIGIGSLNRSTEDYGLSLILGGAEVSLWDLAQGYAYLANAAMGMPARTLNLEKGKESPVSESPFLPSSAWFTLEALKELNRPEEIAWREIPSMQPVAWKTGTSYGFRDAWAVGVTTRYLVAVWVGNATGEGNPLLVGARTAGPVLFDIFNLLPRSPWFERPTEGFVEAEVCPLSGHLRSRFCPRADTLPICPKGIRTDACPYHHIVRGTEETRDTVFELPPAWAWYYRQSHPEYEMRAHQSGDASSSFPMQFVYPTGKLVKVTLPKQLDGTSGTMTFELVHTDGDAEVFWHVDGDYQATTRYIHKLNLHLEKGKHHVTAVDEADHQLTVTVVVE